MRRSSASPRSISSPSCATRRVERARRQPVEQALQAEQLCAGLLRVERDVLQRGADAEPHGARVGRDVVAPRPWLGRPSARAACRASAPSSTSPRRSGRGSRRSRPVRPRGRVPATAVGAVEPPLQAFGAHGDVVARRLHRRSSWSVSCRCRTNRERRAHRFAAGSCCTAQPLPSGSVKRTNDPHGNILDLAHLDAALDQLGAGLVDVGHDQLHALDRARRRGRDALADGDRAGRAGWRQLHEAQRRRSPDGRGRQTNPACSCRRPWPGRHRTRAPRSAPASSPWGYLSARLS